MSNGSIIKQNAGKRGSPAANANFQCMMNIHELEHIVSNFHSKKKSLKTMFTHNYFIIFITLKTLNCVKSRKYTEVLWFVKSNHFFIAIFCFNDKIKKSLPDFCYKKVESRGSKNIWKNIHKFINIHDESASGYSGTRVWTEGLILKNFICKE